MTAPQHLPIWKYLWQLILYAPKLYFLDGLLWLFIMGLPAIPGLIIREFFDQLAEGGTELESAWRSPLILVSLLLSIGAARIVAIFTGRITKTQHRFTMSSLIRYNLLVKLLQKPSAESFTILGKTISPGELISFFRDDVNQIEDNVVGTNEIFGEGMFAIVSLLILFSVNFYLTLLVFLPLVAIAGTVRYLETRIKRYRSASRQSTQQVTGLIGELFGAVQAIQVAGAERSVLQHFRHLNEQRRQRMVQDQVFTAVLNSILENLTTLGTGLILLSIALFHSTSNPLLSVGDFALFVYYLSFVTDFLWFIGGFLTLSKQTEVAFERMGQLIDDSNPQAEKLVTSHTPLCLPNLWGREPELPAIPQPVPDETIPLQVLQANHLTYHYPGTTCGITDISLTLTQGSTTVITGRVGSGKTTLLRSLIGLLPIQSGEVVWNGLRIEQPDRFFVPPRIAYTPQVPQLYSNTLRENLLLGLQCDDETLNQAITLAVLERDLAAMPNGLDTVIGSRGMRLSGGQIQRVAAARMLVRQPALLVFDDLSSALDLETEQKLWSRLSALKHSSANSSPYPSYTPTYLIVSHRPFVLRQADQIILLNEGRVEAIGKLEDI